MIASIHLRTLPACLFLIAGASVAQSTVATAAQPDAADVPPIAPVSMAAVSVAAGVPLRLRVTRTTSMHPGSAVDAIVEQPVYVRDRVAISTGTVLHGVVSGTEPASVLDRTKAWMNGDITPQRTPVVLFRTMDGDNGPMPLNAEARIRSTQWVRFVSAQKHPSLWQQGKSMAMDRMQTARDTIARHGMRDRAVKLFYSQLPYHPQRIWADTQMIADLQTSSSISLPAAEELPLTPSEDLAGLHVRARLDQDVNSNVVKKDDVVTATVTEPVFDAKGGLVLPEGSTMKGRVLQSKPSRSLGRNGQLRFVFADIRREGEQPKRTHGVLTGATGASAENLKVDQEGGVKAQPDKNRFLAPILLAVLSTAGRDGDHENGQIGGGGNVGGQLVASNGFGLIARIISLTVQDPNVSTGFGAFAAAKSVAFRFLTPGHPVNFAKDTMVEVELQSR